MIQSADINNLLESRRLDSSYLEISKTFSFVSVYVWPRLWPNALIKSLHIGFGWKISVNSVN